MNDVQRVLLSKILDIHILHHHIRILEAEPYNLLSLPWLQL